MTQQHASTIENIDIAIDALDGQSRPMTEPDFDLDDSPMFFGGYQIIKTIGHGGVARVFRARHIHPNYAERTFALKLLHPEVAKDPKLREPFRKEAYLLALLKHPNIVRTFEAGIEEDQLFIAMEDINGRDLFDLLSRATQLGQQVPQHVLMHILGEALRGLTYAHQLADNDGKPLGIIHHDINPTNVFLSFDGHVKLGDFGVAGILAQAPMRGRDTAGKVGYFAPEQFTDKKVDQRVDIFCFGVMMFELLCGVAPFDTDSPDETLELNRRAKVVPPRSINQNIPQPVEDIILTCLQRKPTNRYNDTATMLRALEPLLPSRKGMRLACASFIRSAFMHEYLAELKLRRGLDGDDAHHHKTKNYSVVLYHANDAVRQDIAMAAKGHGFDVTAVSLPNQMVDALNTHKPQPAALLIDITDPRINKEELSKARCANTKVIPVVALASNLGEDVLGVAESLGVTDLLIEPVDSNRLHAALWLSCVVHTTTPKSSELPITPSACLPGLLISCDQALGAQLQKHLKRWGYNFDIETSAQAGIDRMGDTTYHVVIYDAFPQIKAECRTFAEQLRKVEGIGTVPVLYLADATDEGRYELSGLLRSSVKDRHDEPMNIATALNQLRADTRSGRSFIRYAVHCRTDLIYSGRTFKAKVIDMSRGGAMLECDEIPPVGTPVGLTLHIDEPPKHISVRGTVVHLTHPGPNSAGFVGVEFVQLSRPNDRDIINLLSQYARKA